MKEFYYNNGAVVKEGDIFFYSEAFTNGNHFHYADSVQVVENEEGELCAKTIISNKNEIKYLKLNDDVPIELKYYTNMFDDNPNNIMRDAIKIGEIGKYDYMLTVEFAEKNLNFFHLDNDKPFKFPKKLAKT